jgi:murein DD-endopeptidase MepM/ murein hydrolase activator NlpD
MHADEFSQALRAAGISFHPVVPFDKERDGFLALDLSAANKEFSGDMLDDIQVFSGYINDLLLKNNVKYGIGGYGELRDVYSKSHVFDGAVPGEEPRRFHLGTDIWGKPNTAVMSPVEGIVHSYAFNNAKGDYGATIILSHHIAGISFHTLYGHLSLNSIKDLQPGERVGKGDIIAEFGIPAENGQWPPHLHFQVILDMHSRQGDYPGVCKYSEREKWLGNSPDPEIILQLEKYKVPSSR